MPHHQVNDDRSTSLLRIPALRALIVTALVGFLGFFITLSSLSLWTVQRGGSDALAGLPTTVMLVVTVASQLLVPAAVHRFGRPAVLAFGLIALGLPTPLLLVGTGIGPILAVSVVRGMGFAVITVLMPLVATDVTPAHRHGAAIGLYGLAIAVPQLIAIPLGVTLADSGNFAWVAWIGAAPILALPFVSLMREHDAAQDSAGQPAQKRTSRPPVAALLPITVVLFTITLAGGGIVAILPVQRSGIVVAIALLVFGIVCALARWTIGGIADRRGSGGLLAPSIAVGVVGLGLLAIGAATESTVGDVLVAAGATFAGAAYGAIQSLTLLIGFSVAGPSRRSGASAVWNASFDLGTAAGALLVGWMAAGTSLGWAMAICAALVAASAVPGLRAAGRVPSPQPAADGPSISGGPATEQFSVRSPG